MFLDRDGTLNIKPPEHEYITNADEFVWLPRAPEAVARLARCGYVIFVVSNQRGFARGLLGAETIHEIERRIQGDLALSGCAIEAFRYCFHDRDAACECRKPKPGMILDLARQFDVDLPGSWMLGDSESDIAAGVAAGCQTALVREAPASTEADLVGGSLWELSELIARRVVSPGYDGPSASNPFTRA